MAKKKSKKPLPSDIAETANRIWLAGLGALSTAEEEGTKAFKKLVEKGKTLESEGRDRMKDRMDKARDVAESAWDGLASSLDDRITEAMHRLGVPTRSEIQTLSERVEALTRKVEGMKAPAKKAPAKKAPAKRAPAKKAPATKAGASKTTGKKPGATKARTNTKLKEA